MPSYPLEGVELLSTFSERQKKLIDALLTNQSRKRSASPQNKDSKRRLLSPARESTEDDFTLPLPSPSASPGQNHYDESDKLSWSVINSYMSQLSPGSANVHSLLIELLKKTESTVLSNLYQVLGNSLRKDLLTQFPPEITNKIFHQLDFKTMLRIEEVCKSWNEFAGYSFLLWKSLCFKDKMIKDETEFTNEFKWVKSKRPSLNDTQIVKLIYKRRMVVKKRWMDPNYQPDVKLLDAKDLGVITCLQFDSDKLVAGSDQSKVIVYDTKTGEKRQELSGHGGGVWAMKYYGNTLATGSTDRSVRIWNIAQGRCTHIFRGHVSTVRCLEIIEPVQYGTDDEGNPIFFPNEPLLVTGSRDTTLNVWKLPLSNENDPETPPIELEENDNPYFLKKFEGHTNAVRAVSGYADIIVSGSYDHKAIVWDLRTLSKKFELIGHTDRIYSCVYDWKRKQCYTGSVDNTVRIWDVTNGKLKAVLEGHQILVGLITISDNNLVSAAADSTVRIWDPDSGHARNVLRGHASAITCVTNDDERVVSGSQGTLILWDANSGKKVRDMGTGITGSVWQVGTDWRRTIVGAQKDDETVIQVMDFCNDEFL